MIINEIVSMETKFVSSKIAADILHVHPNTLRNWESKNIITAYRSTSSGQRKYDVDSFLNSNNISTESKKENHSICYCRVSSRNQKEDLDNQVSFLKSKYPNYEFITDIASGLNYKRKGLRTILDRAIKGTIKEVVVTYKDRLCRFGFELVEYIINQYGGKIMVLNHDNCSPQEEMVKDLTSIIHVFSCRLYGLRRYKKNIKEAIKEETSK